MFTIETRSRSGSAATAKRPSCVTSKVPPLMGGGESGAVIGERTSVATIPVGAAGEAMPLTSSREDPEHATAKRANVEQSP
jgi:hypothetical protein